MRPLHRLSAAALVVVLAAASCSADDATLVSVDTPVASPTDVAPTPTGGVDDGETEVALEAPTADEQPTATVAPPPPTAPAVEPPTPEPTPAPTATSVPPPPSQGCTSGLAGDPTVTSTATADFDGDGASDQITVYALASTGEGAPTPWRIRVDTASGESLDSALEVDPTADAVLPLGGADVDGDDATDELFTVIGTGASAVIVAIHNRAGCEIVQAAVGGAPVGFPVGGGIANIGGLQCIDTDDDGVNNIVVAWSGLADFGAEDGTYQVDGVEYRLRGTELRQVGTRRVLANIAAADFVYGQLSCGGVNL